MPQSLLTLARAHRQAPVPERVRARFRAAMSGIDAALLRGYKKSRASTWQTIEEKAKTNLTLQLMIMNTITEYEKLQTNARTSGADVNATLEEAAFGKRAVGAQFAGRWVS